MMLATGLLTASLLISLVLAARALHLVLKSTDDTDSQRARDDVANWGLLALMIAAVTLGLVLSGVRGRLSSVSRLPRRRHAGRGHRTCPPDSPIREVGREVGATPVLARSTGQKVIPLLVEVDVLGRKAR